MVKHPFRIFICILLIFNACKKETKTAISTEPVNFTKEGELSIFKADSLITKFDIEIAETDYEIQTGLMYRKSMQENRGMLFIFPEARVRSFYMKNTEIPLDIIFIDPELKIASFQKNAQPFNENSLPSGVPAKYVLEINAGQSDLWNFTIGDKVSFKKE